MHCLLQSHLHNTNCNSDPCPTNACWKKCSQLSLSHNHHSLPLQRLMVVFFFLFIQVWMVCGSARKERHLIRKCVAVAAIFNRSLILIAFLAAILILILNVKYYSHRKPTQLQNTSYKNHTIYTC